MNSVRLFLIGVLSGGLLLGSSAARADAIPDSVVRQKLVQAIQGEGPTQQQLLNELAESGAKVVHDVLTAWVREGVYIYDSPDGSKIPIVLDDQLDGEGKARGIRVIDGQFVKDATGKELRFASADLTGAETDMRLRSSIQQSMDTLALAAANPEERNSAVLKLGNSQKPRYIPILQARLSKEPDKAVRRSIDEAVALLQLADPNPKVEIAAVQHLADLKSIGSVDTIKRLMTKPGCPGDVVTACRRATYVIDQHIAFVNFIGTIFHGLSLGSILLVVALGLAITFGLMGIINMAHGEMIAVGAYTCYVVQNIFGTGFGFSITLPISFGGKMLSFGLHIPGLNATGWVYESYFLLAIPLSFLMAGLAGLAIERTVIRFLYRRPLESLLATWGISLVMQQLFRMVFGANNVQVNSPSWLLGHFSINDVTFDYNRVFVIVFAIVIVIGTWLLLTKTPLGLLIRAVMQNRAMAASLGVRTARVNMLTFAFGSALAGLAGAFLSQIGNVGPSLGQTYIVDSFMTVVLGGVGSIVGTVCSAFGIGTADEVLQQTTGSPVTGKIVVLVAIILFLQWKPGGLFASRSRSLD
jgi:urea transport system permease protein